jgi:hypothetical protein
MAQTRNQNAKRVNDCKKGISGSCSEEAKVQTVIKIDYYLPLCMFDNFFLKSSVCKASSIKKDYSHHHVFVSVLLVGSFIKHLDYGNYVVVLVKTKRK